MPLGLAVETFEDGKLDAPQRLEVHATVPTTPSRRLVQPGIVRRAEPRPRRWRCPRSSATRPASSSRSSATRSAGVPTNVDFEEIRLPGDPPDRRWVRPSPSHVLERMRGVGRAAVDPARGRSRFACSTTGSRVEADPARCSPPTSARSRRTSPAARARLPPARRRPARGRWRPDGDTDVLRLVATARCGGRLVGGADRRSTLGRAPADRERPRPSRPTRRPARSRTTCSGPATSPGSRAGAVVHTYPSPGARNVEIDKAVLCGARRAGPALASHGRPAPGQGAAPLDRTARRHG